MATAPEALLEQALTLPQSDRAMLASGLLASLDDDTADEADLERYWSAETERRAEQIVTGDVELSTWENLVGRIDGQRSTSTAE